jgi:LPXTG-motif cell wall-anchored protein
LDKLGAFDTAEPVPPFFSRTVRRPPQKHSARNPLSGAEGCRGNAASGPETRKRNNPVAEAPIIDPPVVEAGAPTAPAVEVAPAPVAEPVSLPELPRTGDGFDMLAGLGGITLALSGLTRFLGRRRR